MVTAVKICGITRRDDALAAARLGAHAVGLVFCARSPRNVSIAAAQEVVAALPPFVMAVGLFVDAAARDIEAVLSEVRLDLLQFHGDETAAFCARFGVPFI